MRKIATLGAILLGLALPATAAAQPVQPTVARHAIHHWWKDHRQPQIQWCKPKRYGTICLLRINWYDGPHIAGLTVCETAIIWVSRTDGHISVKDLGAYLRGTVPLSS